MSGSAGCEAFSVIWSEDRKALDASDMGTPGDISGASSSSRISIHNQREWPQLLFQDGERSSRVPVAASYSHSIVPGGLEVMS